MKLYRALFALPLVLLGAATSESASPACKAPNGVVHYLVTPIAPDAPKPECRTWIYEHRGSFQATFDYGEFLYESDGVESARQEDSKSKCETALELKFEGQAEPKYFVFKFDEKWTRGTGYFLEGECALPLKFKRISSLTE